MIITCLSLVLCCTLLAKSQTVAEKKELEEQMKQDPDLATILQALTDTDKEDLVREERARKAAARQSRVDADLDAMDTDDHENVSVFLISCTFMI